MGKVASDFLERCVGVLAYVGVEFLQKFAVKDGRPSRSRDRIDRAGGLALGKEFLDQAKADRKTIRNLLTRAFPCIIGVQNPLPEVN